MRSIFIQTGSISIESAACPACLNGLPDLIRKHTKLDYVCTQTDTGYFLKPTFRNMPYINSFVPEIDIVVSHNDTQTILHMRGQPIKFVRIPMTLWFASVLMMEVFFLAMAITSNLDPLFLVFAPIIMCAGGYFLCKTATRAAFNSVIKAIQKELNGV